MCRRLLIVLSMFLPLLGSPVWSQELSFSQQLALARSVESDLSQAGLAEDSKKLNQLFKFYGSKMQTFKLKVDQLSSQSQSLQTTVTTLQAQVQMLQDKAKTSETASSSLVAKLEQRDKDVSQLQTYLNQASKDQATSNMIWGGVGAAGGLVLGLILVLALK